MRLASRREPAGHPGDIGTLAEGPCGVAATLAGRPDSRSSRLRQTLSVSCVFACDCPIAGASYVLAINRGSRSRNNVVFDACKMFRIPASVLFTAMGAASTDALKAGISSLGNYSWDQIPWHDWVATSAFVRAFLVASGSSFLVYGTRFFEEMGHQ